MNIWSKLLTALRGGINEAGESVIDTQALRILDQEIRDASHELGLSKDGLASLIAQEKLSNEKVVNIQADIKENEKYILSALDKDEEQLAQDLAVKVADLEVSLSTEEGIAAGFKEQAEDLRTTIKVAEEQIKRLKQQTETVKATEAVQRAQKVIAERHSGSDSKLRTALDSLERVKEKQKLASAKMKAASDLAIESSGTSLEERLKESGIKRELGAADVLERLKRQKKA